MLSSLTSHSMSHIPVSLSSNNLQDILDNLPISYHLVQIFQLPSYFRLRNLYTYLFLYSILLCPVAINLYLAKLGRSGVLVHLHLTRLYFRCFLILDACVCICQINITGMFQGYSPIIAYAILFVIILILDFLFIILSS